VAGLAALRTARGSNGTPFRLILAAFVVAQLPDLDFIPGIFIHDAGRFHRGPTHSLIGAAIIALVIAAIVQRVSPWLLARRGVARPAAAGFWVCYAFVVPVYLSHIALDMMSLDVVGNSGLRLFWPVTNAYVSAPLPLPALITNFFDLEFGPTGGHFFRTLFSLRAAEVYLVEALLFSPLLLVPSIVTRVRQRLSNRERGDTAQHPRLDLEQGAEA
jgi:membrane-bound metal-dependent hydrolase YbcI (DUF457 family)